MSWSATHSEQMESRLIFMLLDHSRGALVLLSANRLIVCVAPMHLKQACCLALVNQNMKRIVTQDLALYWLSSL